MRIAGCVALFGGGAAVGILLVLLGVVDRVDGIPGTSEEPVLSLPTYLGFLSVMLTAVTVVLAALAIGIGVVAAYTFRGIQEAAETAVSNKVDIVLSEDALNNRITKVAFALGARKTAAELEEDFDPQDNGER